MTRKPPSPITRQRGLSLVELMIASLLGLLLMGGIIQLFLSSNATYRVQEGLSRVQETGRYAIDRLAYDIRLAGYVGCGNLDRIPLNVIAVNPPPFDMSVALVGFENGVGWANPTTVAREPGTDVIEIRRASDLSMSLTGNMTADNANIQIVENTLDAQQNQALFITDCVSADLFRASSVSNAASGAQVTIAHANNVNTTNRLSKAYSGDAKVMALRQLTYFVGRANAGAAPGLYIYDGTNTLELVSGVEGMEFQYGVDPDRNFAINGYVDANAVANWNTVRSVRIALLAATTDDVKPVAESLTYTLLGADRTIDDRRLRQVFGADVAVRNRLF